MSMQSQVFDLAKLYKEILFEDSGEIKQDFSKLIEVLNATSYDAQILRQIIWVTCLARPTLFSELDSDVFDLDAEKTNLLQGNIRSLKKLLKTAHPEKLEARPDLVSGGFCLAWENREYLIYLHNEEEIGVQLPFSDTLRYRWFDPVSGTFQPWNNLKSRRPAIFFPPFEEETILLIQAPSLSTRTYKVKETLQEEGPL